MPLFEERNYRKRINAGDMVSCHVEVKETDLWVSADVNLEKETRDLVFNLRQQLEEYIKFHPEFATSLLPFQDDIYAPPIVQKMVDITKKIGVGPMACVAGVIAQDIGVSLLEFSEQVIVENGGDIFLQANRPITVSILAGNSRLSERFGLLIPVKNMPLGVCSSSATVGHSLSMGIADVVCLVSHSAGLADGAATAIGNRIKSEKDLETVSVIVNKFEGIIGGVVIIDDKMATWGDIELVGL